MTGRLAAAIALLALAPAAGGTGYHPSLPRLELCIEADPEPAWSAPEEYISLVESAAASSGVPAWVLARLLAAESGWDAQAVGINRDGSRDLGIAQLGETWLADFAWFDNGGRPFDPFDPAQAVTVAAYNCGLSRVQSGRIPARTKTYVARIFEGG